MFAALESLLGWNTTVAQNAVELKDIALSAELQKVQAHYLEKYGNQKGSGFYSPPDWQRLEYISSILPKADSHLDVGIGSGQFINLLNEKALHKNLMGVDIKWHSKLTLMNEKTQLLQAGVDNLRAVADKSYDTVTCMEVLEHVDKDVFLGGLKELRRVCRGTLFMTVPYNEPLPLPHFHKLRFQDKDLKRYFPQARFTRLKKPSGVDWMLIQENCAA